MKTTNIALHAVLAAISIASHASAQGYVRGSVEEREEVRRETMGDWTSVFVLNDCAGPGNPNRCDTCGDLIIATMQEKDSSATMIGKDGLFDIRGDTNYMEACNAVSAEYDACLGCQGYELEGDMRTDATNGIVHIPGCVNMNLSDCKKLAEEIIRQHPEWFPEGFGPKDLKQEKRQVTSTHDMLYYNLALPIKGGVSGLTEDVMKQEISGLANDCMVYYPWTWCLDQTGNTQCTKLAPFDCSVEENGGVPLEFKPSGEGCLSAQKCCERIQGEGPEANGMARYMYPDINGNRLQCYAWGLDTFANGGEGGGEGGGGGGSGGGGGGDNPSPDVPRLIVHTLKSRVNLPAMITAKTDFVIQADRGFAVNFYEDNQNKWENNQPVSTESIEMVEMNNDVWKQTAAGEVAKEAGYKGNTQWSEVK